MPAIYKMKVTFEVQEFDEYDDEFWEEDWQEVVVIAESKENAEELATEEINENYSAIRDLTFEFLEITECPPDKFTLNPDRNLVSACGRFVSDGFVMIESELVFGYGPVKRFTNPFPEYEAIIGQPLGEYAVTNQQTAVFEAGLVWANYVRQLNKIGVVICAANGKGWPAPFALAKDGRYVGVIMPVSGIRDRGLDLPEQRREFIELHRESGGVYTQPETMASTAKIK